MQITANRLKEVLTTLKPIIPKRSVLPVLKYALLQNGKAIATNLECMAVINCKEAKEPVLLPVKEVLDWMKYIDKTVVLEVAQKGKAISIAEVQKQGSLTGDCGIASTTLESTNPEDFPPVVEMPEGAQQGAQQIDGDWLVETLGEAVVYTEKGGYSPVMQSVCMTLEAGKIRIAGFDGYRLYVQEKYSTYEKGKIDLLIPQDVMPILKSLWAKVITPEGQPNTILMAIDPKHSLIGFQFGNVQFYSQLIQGTYPNYQVAEAYTQDYPIKFKFFAPNMETAVKRVAALAKQGKQGSGLCRLEWENNQMKVSAKYDEQVSASTIRIQGNPDKGRIGINYQCLAEYCKGKDGMVEMGLRATIGAIKLEDGESSVFIMSMFVGWDDEVVNPETLDIEHKLAERKDSA